jgi:hypothetical protein
MRRFSTGTRDEVMARDNHDFERRVDGFFVKAEWLLLRSVVFGVFAYELGKFVWWLSR